MNLTFGVIGLALLTTAVIGKAVEFGSFKLPAVADTTARVLLAALGITSIVLGLLPPSAAPSPVPQAAPQPISTTPNAVPPTANAANADQTTSNAEPSTPSDSSSDSVSTAASDRPPVGSYDMKLPVDHAVQLGASAPTQSQYFQGQENGDISYTSDVYSQIEPIGSDILSTLPNNAAPTYQRCSFNGVSTTVIISPSSGTTFCVKESKLMVGITITSVDTGLNQLSLHVTVWRDA